MDIVRVRYFLAVCEHGSFTTAAKVCGVSQPSVTTGVRRLERAIGGKLLERRHPVRLTPLGTELRPILESLQSAADRVAAAVRRTGGRAGGEIDDSFGVLGRGARGMGRSLQQTSEIIPEEMPDIGPPDRGPIELSDRSLDLFRRSCEAIERSEIAIRAFEWTRKRARESASDVRPDD